MSNNFYYDNGLRGNEAEKKYMQFLTDLHNRKIFHRAAVEKEYAISRQICTSLFRNKFIIPSNHRGKGLWQWIGPEPTIELAHNIIDKHRREMKAYKRLQRLKEQNLSPQLTIKPLKRVASLVEPPVQTIDMHQESQLTWMHLLVIFAAGILAGGLIATIWK